MYGALPRLGFAGGLNCPKTSIAPARRLALSIWPQEVREVVGGAKSLERTTKHENNARRLGPLEGLKVIDLSHIMAGPACSMLLADMGADVIKVEKIPGGDDARRMVPPTVADESAAFLIMNRNKRGIALNLKTEAGRGVLSRLLKDADVLIENYRRGTMEKMGFGYDVLHALNPKLIYCSISGFGRTGPYADRGGFDLVAQGMTGLMSITGERTGGPPMKAGAPVTDITAGILACVGILAALHSRESSGQGQMVDTSLFEAGIAFTYWHSAICFATGQAPGPMGSAHPLNAPYQAFPASDGWITVGAANQENWLRLIEALGAPELRDDPRFTNNAQRMVNLSALTETLSPLFQRRSVAEWLRRLEDSGVPAGPGTRHRANARRSAGHRAGNDRGDHASHGRTGESDRTAD